MTAGLRPTSAARSWGAPSRAAGIAPARPIRVMHLVFALRPGGMEHGVVKIVNGLAPELVTSSICSLTPADAGMRDLVRSGVPIIELNRRAGNDPRVVWAIYRQLTRHRPDILHTHAWGTLVEGLAAGRLGRVPAIVHGEHGTLQLRRRQLLAQRWAWRHVDHLLSVSSRLAERMSADVGIPVDRIRLLRNGVNLRRFADRNGSARAALGLHDASVVVGAVGRLVEVKDHATLIEAIHILRTRGHHVTCCIAGDGPLRGALEAHVTRLGLGQAVRLLGHRTDIEAVLSRLDIFVQSSTSEGMSNTILEAMASGLPVIATHVGGADEMVAEGATGVLVAPRNPVSLADALEPLVSDASLRCAMGRAARNRAEREFSLERMIERYESFYAEVAAQIGGRR